MLFLELPLTIPIQALGMRKVFVMMQNHQFVARLSVQVSWFLAFLDGAR